MSEITETILSIILVLSLQLMVYALCLRPKILAWGTSENEVEMPLPGDDLVSHISASLGRASSSLFLGNC